MRNSLAILIVAALTVTAAGQAPRVDPKAPPKADAKKDPKAPARPEARMEQKSDPTTQSAGEWPSHVGGKSLDQWIKEIEDRDPSHRVVAITAVLQFGPPAKKAVPALTNQVTSSIDQAPRAHAIFALGALVPLLDLQSTSTRDAINALIKELDNNQGTIRIQACRALGAIGPAARAAIRKLGDLMRDRVSNEVRQAAAWALGRVGYDDNGYPDVRALNVLVANIGDVSREVRLECLQSITNLGPPPLAGRETEEYKTHLERRIKLEPDNSGKIWLRVALMRMDPKKINDANLNPIAALMKERGDLDIRVQAARAIGFVGPPAKSKIPELIDALGDPEPLMVWQVLWSLARMQKDAQRALPQIQQIADDGKADKSVREAAKKAIEEINKGK